VSIERDTSKKCSQGAIRTGFEVIENAFQNFQRLEIRLKLDEALRIMVIGYTRINREASRALETQAQLIIVM
jgi:hypothetical protein